MEISSEIAERTILGLLMRNNQQWLMVKGNITDADYLCVEYKQIFKGIVQLAERNYPFDPVTIAEWLDSQQLLDKVGGLAMLGMLAQSISNELGMQSCLNYINSLSRKRQMNGAPKDRFRDDGSGDDSTV